MNVLEELDCRVLVSTPAPPITYVVDGIAAEGHLTAMVAREKSGKSLFALTAGARVASGGGKVAGIQCRGGKVLLLDAENGQNELHRRIRRSGLTIEHSGNLQPVIARGFDLLREDHRTRMADLVDRVAPDLLIIDSFRSMWSGEEVDAGQVAEALDPVRQLVHATGIAGLLLHHARKAGGIGADAYRGGTGIGASVEHIVVLERMPNDPERGRRRLSNPSSRFAAEVADRWVSIEADDDRVAFAACREFKGGRAPVRAEVAEALLDVALRHEAGGDEDAKAGMTQSDLARAVGRSRDDKTVREALVQLATDGLMLRTERGPWRPTLDARLSRNGKEVV